MKTHTFLLGALLACMSPLSAAWGQSPLLQPPAKANAAQPQEPHIIHLTTADDDEFVPFSIGHLPAKPSVVQKGDMSDPNIILSSTGKSPVDKAAVKAREQRDAQCHQFIMQGEDFIRAGNVQEAIVAYKNALAITPTDSLAYQRLAETDMACGKLDEANKKFHKILIEGFGPGISVGVAGNQDVWAEYALALVRTKQDAEALPIYNHAALIADYEIDQHDSSKLVAHLPVMFPEVAVAPDSPSQVQYTPESLQALIEALHAYDELSMGSNKEAIADMKDAANVYPNSAVVEYYLGEALSRSYYAYLDSPAKDKAAALAAYQGDKKGVAAAYQKAADLGDDKTTAAAKERLAVLR